MYIFAIVYIARNAKRGVAFEEKKTVPHDAVRQGSLSLFCVQAVAFMGPLFFLLRITRFGGLWDF